VAPRGAQVAVARVDPQLNTLDVWTYDGARPLPRRVSPSINIDDAPAWSGDGTRVAWVNGRQTVSVRDARAETPETALRKFDRPIRVTDWTDDDQWIVLSETQSDSRGDIRLMRARPDGEAVDYLRTPFHETAGVVSPDGRWLAYVSDESGHDEIYVDAFPRPRSRARLTLGGGEEPRWSRDGRQVFFRRGSEIHMIGVAAAGDSLEALASERLFDAGAEIRSFDMSPGGDRFLLNMPAPGAGPRPLMVLLNVSSLLPSAQ
jgi:Tol biopolymer transport system component